MNVIEARGLRKSFGTTIALDGIDLQVDEGRIFVRTVTTLAAIPPAWVARATLIPYRTEPGVFAAWGTGWAAANVSASAA